MRISVIIPVYNDPKLAACLSSIYQSQNVDFEVIVVDDGSTTVDVKKITSKFPSCKTYSFQKNKGAAAARNYGVKQASGETVFFIDSDAEVYPDTLKKICRSFENDKTIDGITVIWSDITLKGGFFNKFKAVEMNYELKNYNGKVFGSNGSAIYKNKLLAQGGFDEYFKSAHAEDFHLGLMLASRGYKLIFDRQNAIKHSYPDRFLFHGFKKYCKRAFLRAMVICRMGDKSENLYSNKRFKIIYLLSLSTIFFLISAILHNNLIFLSPLSLILFLAANHKLYLIYSKKYGRLFFLKAVIFHFFYIFCIAVSGSAGLIYAFLVRKQRFASRPMVGQI